MANVGKCTLDDFIDKKDEYLKCLEDYSNWDDIPLLNYDPLYYPDKTLVRFRGMVQDMYNPEIYLESYEVSDKDGVKRILNGKYQDINSCSDDEQINIDSEANVNGERQTLFVISIPGLNDWVCDEEQLKNKIIQTDTKPKLISNKTQGESTKRILDLSDLIKSELGWNSENAKEEQIKKEKCEENLKEMPEKPVEFNMEDFYDNSVEDGFYKNCSLQEYKPLDKQGEATMNKLKNAAVSEDSIKQDIKPVKKVSLEYILNSPIPNKPSKACIVKIYDNFDKFKVNEMVDVVGFLSTDPRLVSIGDDNMCENQADNLPPSVVPRLHAVCIKQIVHCNPLLDRTQQVFENLPPTKSANIISANDIEKDENPYLMRFNDLHRILTHILFGDELAAELTIFHLISRVFSRRDVTPLGGYSLNITNVPSESTMKNVKSYLKQFYDLLSSLIPASHTISLTIDELNTAMFVPKKDYQTDRLVSGQLQLANGTHLFIDEIGLEAGKLNEAGVVNLQALRAMIRDQSIKYNFQYYGVDYECDIPVLVLSEGRSILDIQNQVPLEIDEKIRDNFENIMPALLQYLTFEIRDNIRSYLTCIKYSEFIVEENMLEVLQNDFVVLLGQNDLTPEDLHSYMTLARLYSLSRGFRKLTMESWNAVKNLEQKRRSRLTVKKNAIEM